MKEEFLHFVWKYRFYDPDKLRDQDGNLIEVINPGIYNRDAGPDFFNARLKIGDTEWAGNVEIHVKASHFEVHGHHRDHNYDNVILHATAEKDKKVRNARGKEVPTVELSIVEGVYKKYTDLLANPGSIACESEIPTVDRFLLSSWLQALIIERLTRKAAHILKVHSDTGGDWEETLYRMISRYFGFRVNSEPFEMLSVSVPFRILRKHADNRQQLEALLFGCAGMLDEGLFRGSGKDPYFNQLAREFRALSAKYSLNPLHGWIWKFSRLRPVNFPTLRISQLAGMLSIAGGLFSKVAEMSSVSGLRSLFEVEASEYWNSHFLFGKESGRSIKKTGESAADILLINAVIPVLFSYGLYRNEQAIKERALGFLDELTAEDNSITKDWERLDIIASSALESQALIQLWSEYCRRRRCIECRIGARFISEGAGLKKPHELILEP